MLGDGLNDAPVIAQADVSIALAGGSMLAQARADFIVLNSRLADVEYALSTAHRARRIVRQNLGWAFVYNVVIIPLAAFGIVSPALAAAGMAASSLGVIANALRAPQRAHRRSAATLSVAASCMESLYLLIPLSVLLVLAIAGILVWAVDLGQFERLDDAGARF